MQTLPSALGVLTAAQAGTAGASGWSPLVAKVASTMVVRYAGSAYRLPLANAAVSAVLAYAEAQLGKPYVWAGAGPANFDCSGLTMMAYRGAGVPLTHNAYAQYEATKAEAVPVGGLQTGDLVFFGPNEAGIHHVGIYVGNHAFLDAPDTGSVVRFDTLGPGWDYFGATRPLASGPTQGWAAGAFTASLGLDDNHVGPDAVLLPGRAVEPGVRLEFDGHQRLLGRLRHPPGPAGRQDGLGRGRTGLRIPSPRCYGASTTSAADMATRRPLGPTRRRSGGTDGPAGRGVEHTAFSYASLRVCLDGMQERSAAPA